MDDRFNTIAGWLLGGGIVLLGGLLVGGEIFGGDRPETMGYPIANVQEEGGSGGGEAEQPIAFYLATADAGRGEAVFRKCTACHTINQGGANGIGPNLWATMGQAVAHVAGYSYSEALRGRGGQWDWQTMSDWLRNPRSFAPGTKMTFAGLSNPQDRADLLLYLNAQGSNLPVPPPPAPAGDAPANGAGANEQVPAGNEGPAQADQPVVNEQQVARQPEGNAGGEGAPGVAGNSSRERR